MWLIEMFDHYIQLKNKWYKHPQEMQDFLDYDPNVNVIYLLRGKTYDTAKCINVFKEPADIIPFLSGFTDEWRKATYKAKGNVTNLEMAN